MSDLDPVRRLLAAAVGRVFPSAQLVIVDGERTLLDEAVGDATRQTWFDVASLTKPLCTTTLVMSLVDAGRLALDEVLREPGITVEHALAHTSGLPAWRALGDEARAAGATSAVDVRAAILEAVRREPVEVPPGTRSLYSDFGFILLGEAVARAGRAPLDRQLEALLTRAFPSLNSAPAIELSFHPPVDRCAPTLADPALCGVVHDENARALGPSGHAGLFATARAVSSLASRLCAVWAGADDALLGLRSSTVRRFWSPCGVPRSTWCLGWDRPSPPGFPSQAGTRWSREGVGHTGFTGTSLWIDPARARHVVLLSNRVYPSRSNADDRAHGNDAIKAFRPALHDAIVAALPR